MPILRAPKPEQATEEETDRSTKIPIGSKVLVEFTKIKKEPSNPKDAGKRIVSQTKKVRWMGGRYTFIQRGQNRHFLDMESLMWDKKRKCWKLQYDENYCEPLGKDGKPHRNPTVSLILRDESMMQLITIAQMILPIQITRTMLIAMSVFGGFAALFMLAVAPSIAPHTVIHWLPSKPVILP